MMISFLPNGLEFVFALAFLGTLSGFLAGLLGVGGGFVLVPGLYAIFQMKGYHSASIMHSCIGTSLSVIVFTGLSSARAHWKKNALNTALLPRIGAGIILGAFLGTAVAAELSSQMLQLIFTLSITALSMIMIFDPAHLYSANTPPPFPALAGAGVAIGFISTLMGIGGATLSVPFMRFFKTPIHTAIGTASALGILISIPATLGYILIGLNDIERPPLSLGYIHVPAWLLLTAFAFMMAPLGAWTAHKIPVTPMRKIFAIFMIGIALKMGVELL